MKSKRIIIAVPIGAFLFFKIGMLAPYERFRADEAKARPLFYVLNKDIYSQIPIPPGVERTSTDPNVDVSYGTFLSIDYLMVNTTVKRVSRFYEEFLLGTGWKKYNGLQSRDTTLYYRETSCFEITMYDKYSKGKYEVVIYHDYLKQNFSPILPPVWIY